MLKVVIRFFLENKLVTAVLAALVIGAGVATAPFDWRTGALPRSPVPVDAIPDIGENQQIVFTEWMGRSPRDVEDQITYPLTTALLGLPGVESVRSTSMFGFSTIAVIFGDGVEYYWSRARVLEKLAALPPDLLPEGVAPTLGPDATALGQVFWYTLEGRDADGNPAGGWDLHELRSIQDYHVRPALSAEAGVSEVASVGGFVREYQVELDPPALAARGIGLMEVAEALRNANRDAGANTLEINRVEYLVRGLGAIQSIEDIEEAVITIADGVPVRIRDVARVQIGPATRGHGGILDKGGSEAVGGVVTARYGDNPLRVIAGVKEKVAEIAAGLPARTLDDGRVSKVTVVPFYDRTELIQETLQTLYDAISLQVLITIIVILILLLHLRAALAISAMLPLAVLLCFVMMRYFGVDANVVALSGIAIAIGTIVDLGIVLSENVLRHEQEEAEAKSGRSHSEIILDAVSEVSGAILTAVATTIVSFLPVFTLQAAEGKLFGPLAWTKTFALVAALLVTFVLLPALLHIVLALKASGGNRKGFGRRVRLTWNLLLLLGGTVLLFWVPWTGIALLALGLSGSLRDLDSDRWNASKTLTIGKKGRRLRWVHWTRWLHWHRARHGAVTVAILVAATAWWLADLWRPLGVGRSVLVNFLFVAVCLGLVLGAFTFFLARYTRLLDWCLRHKAAFLALPLVLVLLGFNVWLGFDRVFGPVATAIEKTGWNIRASALWSGPAHAFPGMGKEFMPSLDEGAFLLMPTTMPHAGVEENRAVLRELDRRVQAIPEVHTVVGKAGRAETALDPAPLSMFENVILYKSEYGRDADGNRVRQWRDHIRTPDDIWEEIVAATSDIPGATSAPKLQPIETRLVMLQTGMRTPMGVKVFGPDIETIEAFSLRLEEVLKEVPSVRPEGVYADRSLGKPYLEIDWDRRALARHGLSVEAAQHVLETAAGGMPATTTVEGRERYVVRARYAREWRDSPESLARILLAAPTGAQVPLGEVASIGYRAGPMMIRGEDAFPVGYVMLDKREGFAEVTVVEDATRYLQGMIASGELEVPAGVSWRFSGAYENQVRAERRLAVIVPLSLALIFLILHLQFRSTAISLMIFSGVALSFAGGFLLLWLYGFAGFMDVSLFGVNLRELFQIRAYNLSVAVWVGFIALFGISIDNGVVMAAYLRQSFARLRPENVTAVRAAVLDAALKRARPCLMTTATTLLALLPVLTSRGRGSDIMVPMAIPAFGGMLLALLTLFLVPVLYALAEERRVRHSGEELP